MMPVKGKIHRPPGSGTHPLRIDFISWYSGIVAGIKINPSILAANSPRSITHKPRLLSEMDLIFSRQMRFLNVNQLY